MLLLFGRGDDVSGIVDADAEWRLEVWLTVLY
jgi:hypothetical protein